MLLTPAEEALNARIETEGLHLKFGYQLVAMAASHAAKIPHVEEDLDKVLNYPDAVRWELKEAEIPADEIEAKLASQVAYYQWKKTRLEEIVSLIADEQAFRKDGKVKRTPIGTVYYIDADNGNDGNLGTSTGAAWRYLDKFTEAARSAGDKAILRRGMTNRYDDGTDLVFSSDGSIDNPIIIEADYANAFGDDVDLSATATATLIFGSKTITFASDISGVLAAGDWIYASGDDAKEFAYEVDSVSTVTVTLFLPYKGAQAGSGKTMTNMQSPPIWNAVAASFQLYFDGDDFWRVQGIHIRGIDTFGNVAIDDAAGHYFVDAIFEGNGSSTYGIYVKDSVWVGYAHKCRFYNHQYNIHTSFSNAPHGVVVSDSLFDGNDASSSTTVYCRENVDILFTECEMKGHTSGDIAYPPNSPGGITISLRNCLLLSANEVDPGISAAAEWVQVFSEDHNGTIGDTRQLGLLATTGNTPSIQSETSKVRSGGGNTSIKVTPSTKLSTAWPLSRKLLFELPIYATTAEKTYTVYFASDTIAEWTANPTAGELWIELEYWGHASNNFRRITRSTGTLDFKTDTDFDQTLALTITPSQAGVAYLRCYYAKTKESAKTNIFYCDPKVEIA